MTTPMGLSAAVRASTEALYAGLGASPKLQVLLRDGPTRDQYQHFLRDLYHLVWHFNPVCAAAASRLDDRFRPARYYLYGHMLEERGHEEIVLADMEAVGLNREEETRRRPTVWTATTVAYNYYSAERQHPMAVFGMLYSLERIASRLGGPMSAAAKRSLALEGSAGTRFLAGHAELDTAHVDGLETLLDAITDAAAHEAVVESVRVNDFFFVQALQQI